MTGQIKMSTRIIIGSHDLPCSLPLTFSFDDLMPYWVTENLTLLDDLLDAWLTSHQSTSAGFK